METRKRRKAWVAVVAAAVGLAAGSARGDEGVMAGLDYPSFGVSLIGPTGWSGKFVVSKYVVARWLREDPGEHGPRGVVEIRALPAKGMTLREFADLVGKQIGGGVVDKSMKVDGAAAWRLDAGQQDGDVVVRDALRPRGAVVGEHDGVLYAILGGGLPWEDWRGAVRQVADRWKWIAIEPPWKRLRYLEVRPLLMDGRVVVPLPVGMGPAEPERGPNDADDRASLSMYDFKRGGDDFAMSLALDERRDGEAIDAYRDRLLRSVRARANAPLEWREVPELTARRMTPLLKVAGPADGGGTTYERYACIEQDDRHALVVKFTIVAADDEERDFYARQTAYMLREMEVTHGAAPFRAENDRGR